MRFAFFLAFFMGAASFGKVVLELPVKGEYSHRNKAIEVSVSKLNKELAKLGLEGIPEVVVIGENPERYFKVLERRIEAAGTALDREFQLNIFPNGTNANYLYEWENLCYRGEMTEVPALLKSMQGNFLNESEGLLAFAAGKKKIIEDQAFKSREGLMERFDGVYEELTAEIDAWFNYKSTSKHVLVMSDYGPQGDGTELEVTEIPPCKTHRQP